ncbi:MAG TPA: sigma 54-interacting transcriptional regulator [Gemmataceae bacterium]|nr:sigma 54-interacting transcriptional regulator [Gemmataceae bacterium]
MRARLVIVRGDGTPPVFDLDPTAPVTLGRSRENTVVLHDEHASRAHAKVYHDAGRWLIKDCGTRNHTFLNGIRVQDDAVLLDGHEIGIGGVRLRFLVLNNGVTWTRPPQGEVAEPPEEDSGHTTLHADELAPLHEFMSMALKETDSHAIVAKALATVAGHTRATFAGYLSLDDDEEQPCLRLVHPETAEVDWSLSKQLTERVRASGRAVWIKAGVEDLEESESLLPFQDAVCVPLQAEGGPLGALHVYKSGRCFTQDHVRFCELVAGYAAVHLARLRQNRSLIAENSWLRGHAPISDQIIGDSPALKQLHQLIGKAAACRSTVLIQGETGAGKELVALALHRQSRRCKGPMVVANCGAIVPTLLESELFGHCEGAFTGATSSRKGLFEQADDGTLFLDEIGDMTPDCQVKVLRVLEGKGFRPVGGTKEIKSDVRLVAATHKDLAQEVRAGRFRQDLYFRLRVLVIMVPPLRDHIEDLPALVNHFLDKFAVECGRRKTLSPAALQRLRGYSWPGNVRELRTVIESAVMMSDGDMIEVRDLCLQDTPFAVDQPVSLKLEHVEAWAIRQAMQKTGWNQTQAAKILDISRETLSVKLRKYEIVRDSAARNGRGGEET